MHIIYKDYSNSCLLMCCIRDVMVSRCMKWSKQYFLCCIFGGGGDGCAK
jgi:hypothetical protein